MRLGNKKSLVAALVSLAAVFVIIHRCEPESCTIDAKSALFVLTMGLVLFADDVKVSVVVTMALAALALDWQNRRSRVDNEQFSVGAPHAMHVESANTNPLGTEASAHGFAGARVSFGAGSERPLLDPGIGVEELKRLTPPELLAAAQSNEVPARSP